jgi:hypothetical protein
MEDGERYEQICKPKFGEIHKDTQAILRILRGVNGAPGIVDDVRDLKRWRDEQRTSRKAKYALITTIVLVLLTQVFVVVRTWVTERDDGQRETRTTETATPVR